MVDGMSDMGTTELGAASTPEQARAAFRDGLVRPTCGIAQGYAQANLMILPKEQAFDFLLFAQRNPKPCPLLEVMEPGVTALVTAPGAVVGRLAAQAGLRVFHEAFADRAYNADGTLVSRRLPDAVIADPAEVAARVLRMVREHEVVAIDGTVVPLNADSVCVHGDSPSAVAMARAVRARLESEGVAIRAFAGDAAASAARD